MAVSSGIVNIFKIAELRKRLFFTLGMLAVYRLGIFVTTPGVDRVAMKSVVNQQGSFLNLMNFFSGGGVEQLSIFALGIMPYVSASIILQLLTVVIPTLEALQKEGELGRRKITQYTRYLTVVLSAIQGYGIATFLEAQQSPTNGAPVVGAPGWGFRL
jgi:preprotein translocase subunit SecY